MMNEMTRIDCERWNDDEMKDARRRNQKSPSKDEEP
jgi:hypothetical protein